VVEGEATLKRVYYYPEEAKLILTAENPAYAPLVFVGAELEGIHILGRAVAFQSKVR
jgi:repressor LexA